MACAEISTCRLCLATALDKNLKRINITKDILDISLLNLKFEDGNKHVVCGVCCERLNLILKFKSMCLSNYNRLILYVDCEGMSWFDLKKVYMKENETVISQDEKVCFLCMQLVRTEFRCVRDEELDSIQKLISKIPILEESSDSSDSFSESKMNSERWNHT